MKRFLLTGALVALASLMTIFSLPTSTYAQNVNLEQQIIDPTVPVDPDPVDVCPNIDGPQATLPAGMQHDSAGHCYTPTPPAEPVDLCSNLDGMQELLPAGMYRTAAGNCYPQPVPPGADPVDVCMNLPDLQVIVPEGYALYPDGTCQQPATQEPDACPNIPGPQTSVPYGMLYTTDRGCYTPTTAAPTLPTEPTPPRYKNVPDILAPAITPIVNLVPEAAKQWLRSLPESVAKTTPYYIFILLGFLALIPLLQSIREAFYVRQLLILLKKERDIAEEKDNFIALASHYLRTPLTLMKNGLDTIVALKETPALTVKPLDATLDTLSSDISTILSNIEQNKTLHDIAPPVFAEKTVSIWRSSYFWGPIVGSVVLTILANFLFGVVGDKEIGGVNMFLQIIVACVAVIILYTAVRNLHIQRKLRAQKEQLLAHEQAIDSARNQFIEQTTATLTDGLGAIDVSKPAIAATPSVKYFDEGYGRFRAILEKFLLLTQIQTGAARTYETFNLRSEVDSTLSKYAAAAEAKHLTIENTTPHTSIQQNRALFNFVISSLLDNAIKFNPEGGTITIGAEPQSKTLKIAVKDTGIGIPSDKLDQLFKPFSRATSSVEFNYEGLGFSLFLDKIIMDYTGGTIYAHSEPNAGTNMVVRTPLTIAS